MYHKENLNIILFGFSRKVFKRFYLRVNTRNYNYIYINVILKNYVF